MHPSTGYPVQVTNQTQQHPQQQYMQYPQQQQYGYPQQQGYPIYYYQYPMEMTPVQTPTSRAARPHIDIPHYTQTGLPLPHDPYGMKSKQPYYPHYAPGGQQQQHQDSQYEARVKPIFSGQVHAPIFHGQPLPDPVSPRTRKHIEESEQRRQTAVLRDGQLNPRLFDTPVAPQVGIHRFADPKSANKVYHGLTPEHHKHGGR